MSFLLPLTEADCFLFMVSSLSSDELIEAQIPAEVPAMAQRQVLFCFHSATSAPAPLLWVRKHGRTLGTRKALGTASGSRGKRLHPLQTTAAGARCSSANVTALLQAQGEFKDRKPWLNINVLHRASSPELVAAPA